MPRPTHYESTNYHDLISFAKRLNGYAASLTRVERRILAMIILGAMDPIERMRWRNEDDLLQTEEAEILRELLKHERH